MNKTLIIARVFLNFFLLYSYFLSVPAFNTLYTQVFLLVYKHFFYNYFSILLWDRIIQLVY